MLYIYSMRDRFSIAKKDIVQYFSGLPSHVFRRSDLSTILETNKDFWRLSNSMGAQKFIQLLLEKTALQEITFAFPARRETRYIWGDVPFLVVVASLKSEGFFSHYTAMQLHDLTDQIPTTIFLNQEQPPKYVDHDAILSQESIELAFQQLPRKSNNIATVGEYHICLLNGKHTGRAGVAWIDLPDGYKLPLSSLERTLIDITVRPAYSGGVQEVMQAFARAKEKVSVNLMMALLQKMEFVYPYHQAIGFYLERTGYRPEQLDLVRKFSRRYDFYLAHSMKVMEYAPQWRLFFPKGL